MLKPLKRKITRLQNCVDGGTPLRSDYLIFNEDCLDSILESRNQKELFSERRAVCAICDEKVNRGNLRAIVPNGSKVDFLCTKPFCIDEYFYTKTKR